MTYRHPLAFLLGLEGAALLRAFVGDGGLDRGFTEERIAETRALLARAAELGEGTDFGAVGTVAGYRAWSATYDQAGGPLARQWCAAAADAAYGGTPAALICHFQRAEG